MSAAHTQRPTTAPRGFTLIESLIVLVVIAIIASSAAPSLRSQIELRRLDGAATQLAVDLQFIRTETVARNQALRISFPAGNADGSCYVIHSGSATDCTCEGNAPAQCIGTARALKTVWLAASDRVALQSNVGSMLFDPLHGTSTPTGTLRLIGTEGRAIHHVVNIMGRVRSCSPLGATPGYRNC